MLEELYDDPYNMWCQWDGVSTLSAALSVYYGFSSQYISLIILISLISSTTVYLLNIDSIFIYNPSDFLYTFQTQTEDGLFVNIINYE